MFEYGLIFPLTSLWFSEKQHFRHKKPDSTLFHDFSASQPSSSAKNEQNVALKLWQNSGETDLVTLIHKNITKIGCFGAFSHFFCFWELWTHKLFFYSANVGRNIPNDRYMPQVYGTFKFDQKTKLSFLQSTVGGWGWGGPNIQIWGWDEHSCAWV